MVSNADGTDKVAVSVMIMEDEGKGIRVAIFLLFLTNQII
jgi:hypothetical protein